jgi:glycerophosphoryl diester phosphodiesterase
MKNLYPAILLTCLNTLLIVGCKTQKPVTLMQNQVPAFLKEGHRGTRGLMPENTIPAMRKAIDVGANVLELDIQISQDNQVVVAHDPYINTAFTLGPDGNEIPAAEARKILLYQLPYSQIRQYDVGSKDYPAYPKQQKMPAYMPWLGELIDSVEQYLLTQKLPPVIYNIEIKSNPQQDGIYQPEPATLVKLVMEVVKQKQLPHSRYYVQSFDIRQIK